MILINYISYISYIGYIDICCIGLIPVHPDQFIIGKENVIDTF